MNARELITAMFLSGELFFEHHILCDGDERYVVMTLENDDILFLCTKEWWNNVRDTHPALSKQTADCGCIIETIVPNSSLHLAMNAVGVSLN